MQRSISRQERIDESWVPSGQYTRAWLVGLLLLTAVVASAALFAKYKLEGLRGAVLQAAEAKTGLHLSVASITSYGLRGLRAEGVNVTLPTPRGVTVNLRIPNAIVDIDLVDLLSGTVTIERVQLDGASLTLTRDPNQPWTSDQGNFASSAPGFHGNIPFRLTGENCSLTIENVVGDTHVALTKLHFDVARLRDSPSITSTIDALWNDIPDKKFNAELRYTSPTDFSLRAACSQISADDVNTFLPASRHIVQQGIAAPTLQVATRPDGLYDIMLDASFQNIVIQDQPAFLQPESGTLNAVAKYNPADYALTLAMSRAQANAVEGRLSGTVSFADKTPVLDLTLTSFQLPLKDVAEYILKDRIDQYGAMPYTIAGNNELTLHLTGPSSGLRVGVIASADGGELGFIPKNAQWPHGNVKLGRLEVSWDSVERAPKAFATLIDGQIEQKKFGVSADHISATVALENGIVTVSPVNAHVTDQPWTATAKYNIDKHTGEATVAGTFTNIEKTPLAATIRNAELAGAVNVNARATFTETSANFEGDVDATQTDIAYRWYFHKQPGIGAGGHVRGEFVAKKKLNFDITARVAGTDLTATSKLAFVGTHWALQSTTAASDHVDLVTVGKCVSIPYEVISGNGKKGSYEWTRTGDQPGDWRATISLDADEAGVRVKGQDEVMRAKDVTFGCVITEGTTPTGEITLTSKSATMPPLRGAKWFVPFEYDETKYPPVDRRWVYHLASDSLEVPPWKGANFKGECFTTLTESGLSKYSADVDGGTIEGSFHNNRLANAYEASNEWKGVPAHYFMEYLHLPMAFSGSMGGKVTYAQDRDDPRTLNGAGYFEIDNGQFSADFLISMIEHQMQNETAALPPSLRFSSLKADIQFDKDLIKTPSIKLVSDAIALEGSGQFVTEGDMDYNIKVAVSPNMAERIPILRENFNVEGHKLAQRDIELAFRLTGPTVKPISQVTETPPLHVTLVSGSLEAANEALRVIDAPRKILVDLLKTGGGILGAKR